MSTTPCTAEHLRARTLASSLDGSFGPFPEATDVKEIWFAGSHSDVGGGEMPADGNFAPRLSYLPLRWMIREAFDCGLQLDVDSVVSSTLYAPWIHDAEAANLSINQPVREAKDSSLRPEKLSMAFVDKLVHLATDVSHRLVVEALAPRRDSLSLAINLKAQGIIKKLKSLPLRIRKRALVVLWWILESAALSRKCDCWLNCFSQIHPHAPIHLG